MSNLPGGAPEWLTPDYIETMLKRFFNDDSLRIVDVTIKPASSVSDNYLGQLFRIEATYARKNQKETRAIIAKSLPETKLNSQLEKEMDCFTVEAKMLSETLPLLCEELRAQGEATERFFPYVYKVDVGNKTIFMEDLNADGHIMLNKVESLDLDHTLLVIKVLAKMHAASYLLLKKDPTHKDHYLHHIYAKCDDGKSFMETAAESEVKSNIESLHAWPITEEDKNIFRSFSDGRLWDLVTDSYRMKKSNFNVLIHGDCWSNNLMFKYKNGKLDSVKLLDFQISNYNSFALDIHFLLFLSAREYVKLEHLEDVFKTYYDTFVGVTGKIEGFTIDSVRKEFIDTLGAGFLCAIYFRHVMLSDKPFDIEAQLEGRSSQGNDEIYLNPVYISEAVKLLPLFKKHGIFK